MKGKLEVELDCGVHSKWFSAEAVRAGNIDTRCDQEHKRKRKLLRKDRK